MTTPNDHSTQPLNPTPDVESIFHHARGISDAQERAAYLAQACGPDSALRAKVDALLAAGADMGQFLASRNPAERSTQRDTHDRVGTRLDKYKLLQLIGEGGFGTVYLAEQDQPVRRRVALKIIKPGMDSRMVAARFEAERQALALMDHPHIARVIDGGITDPALGSRPYFVMEYVVGDPITNFADAHKLSINDRLGLFTQVCEAVQHAHTKGIIHRDLKPGNVLASMVDGKPFVKVIDFGIAKSLASRLTEKTLFTEHRQLIGTPEYMSPEQAEGSPDIDTRADVYALGVLLYELLAGVTPFDGLRLRSAAFAEMQRIIREEEPPLPSVRVMKPALETPSQREGEGGGRNPAHDPILDPAHDPKLELARTRSRRGITFDPRAIKGELDWIVMKALDKDRARRYETANQLAADVRRHLAGEAVVAAPASAGYRLRKFVRKNKGPVVAVSAVMMALAAGGGVAAWQWKRASGLVDSANEMLSGIVAQHAVREPGSIGVVHVITDDSGHVVGNIRVDDCDANGMSLPKPHVSVLSADSTLDRRHGTTPSGPEVIRMLGQYASNSASALVAKNKELRAQVDVARSALGRLININGPGFVCMMPDDQEIIDPSTGKTYETVRSLSQVMVDESGRLYQLHKRIWMAPPVVVGSAGNREEAIQTYLPDTDYVPLLAQRAQELGNLSRSREAELQSANERLENGLSSVLAEHLPGVTRFAPGTFYRTPDGSIAEVAWVRAVDANGVSRFVLETPPHIVDNPDMALVTDTAHVAVDVMASLAVNNVKELRGQREAAEWSAYTANLALAQATMAGEDFPEARRLLERTTVSRRGWEYWFLDLQAKAVVVCIAGVGERAHAWIDESGRISVQPLPGGGSVQTWSLDKADGWQLRPLTVNDSGIRDRTDASSVSVIGSAIDKLGQHAAADTEADAHPDCLVAHAHWNGTSRSYLIEAPQSPPLRWRSPLTPSKIADHVHLIGMDLPWSRNSGNLAVLRLDQLGGPEYHDPDHTVLFVASVLARSPGGPSGLTLTTPDGTRRIVGGADKTVRFYEAKDGKPTLPATADSPEGIYREVAVFRMNDTVTNLQMTGDGLRLIIHLADGSARVWDIRDPDERRKDLQAEWAERVPAGQYLDTLWASERPDNQLRDAVINDATLTPLRRLVAVEMLEERLEDDRIAAEQAFAAITKDQTDKAAVVAGAAGADLPKRVKARLLATAADWEYKPPQVSPEMRLVEEARRRRVAEVRVALKSVDAGANEADAAAQRRSVLDALQTLRLLADSWAGEFDLIAAALATVAEPSDRILWADLHLRSGDAASALSHAVAAIRQREGDQVFALEQGRNRSPKEHGESPTNLAVLALIRWKLGDPATLDALLHAADNIDEQPDSLTGGRILTRDEHRAAARAALAKARTLMAPTTNPDGTVTPSPWADDADAKALLAEAEQLIEGPVKKP